MGDLICALADIAQLSHASRGLPSISAQRNSCLQNGLSGKRPQGLGFWASSSHRGYFVSNQIRCGLPAAAADKFRSNMQVNSKYYDTAWRRHAERANTIGRDSLPRGVREVVAGGRSRAIFPLPLGHRRFSVKGSYSSFIEDEDG
jgi:hypothetical protein